MGEERYDAFLSYSHAADGALVPKLHHALEVFAKPWYRLRALSVFHDTSGFGVDEALWPHIAEKVAAARTFIVLASPDAAASKWVNREIEEKIRLGGPIFIVLTAGELGWSEAEGDFDEASTAVPPALRGHYHDEPLWLDFRWVHKRRELDLDDPRFRDGVTALAAAIRGIDKAEMASEALQQHRRTLRLARAAVAALTTLLAAAVVLAVLAYRRTREAEQARAAAEHAEKDARDEAALAKDTLRVMVAGHHRDNAVTAALLLREVDKPERVAEWLPLAVDIERRLVPHHGVDAPLPIASLTATADGRFATTSADGLRIWPNDLGGSPKLLPQFKATFMERAVFSPDGQRIAFAAHPKARVIATADGSDRELPSAVESVVFSRDGRRMVAIYDAVVHVFESDGRGPLFEVAGTTDALIGADFGPDGRLLVYGDAVVKIVSPDGKGEPSTLKHDAYVTAAAFSPDGSRVLTGSSNVLTLWSSDGGGRRSFRIDEEVNEVGFSRHGRWRYATTHAKGDTGKVKLYLWSDDEPNPRWATVDDEINRVAFSDDDELVAFAWDRFVRVMRPREPSRAVDFDGHDSQVVGLDFHGGWLTSAAKNGAIKRWRPLQALSLWPREQFVSSARFAPDGQLLVASGRLRRHVAGWGEPVEEPGIEDAAFAQLTAAGALVWGSQRLGAPDTLHVRAKGGERFDLARPLDFLALDPVVSPDGSRVIARPRQGALVVWDWQAGRVQDLDLGGANPRVVFSADGRYLAGTTQAGASLWSNDPTPRKLAELVSPTRAAALAAAFSGDSRRVAIGFADRLRAWSVDAPTTPELDLDDRNASCVALSADGSTLAEQSERFARLLTAKGETSLPRGWDAIDENHPCALVFDPSEKLLLSASGTLWSLGDPPRVERLGAPQGAPVYDASFSPDGQRVAARTLTSVELWTVGVGALQAALFSGTNSCLSAEQRVSLLGEAKDAAARGEQACRERVAGR